jgi:hypothetical protein
MAIQYRITTRKFIRYERQTSPRKKKRAIMMKKNIVTKSTPSNPAGLRRNIRTGLATTLSARR